MATPKQDGDNGNTKNSSPLSGFLKYCANKAQSLLTTNQSGDDPKQDRMGERQVDVQSDHNAGSSSTEANDQEQGAYSRAPPSSTDTNKNRSTEEAAASKDLKRTLRSKATGKIDLSSTSLQQQLANKRIVFGDDDEYVEDGNDNEALEKQAKTPSSNTADASDDDDDDDAVEEVQTSKARVEQQEKRLEERDSARAASSLRTKKRRRKKKSNEEKDDEFDAEFFQQLEEEKQAAKEERKKAKRLKNQSKGRHTSFVVAEQEDSEPIQATEDGVQVAVIPADHARHDFFTEPPIPASLLYSRGRLENGCDGLSDKQIQKAHKRKQAAQPNPSWQRSTKMNRLVGASSRQRRRRGGPAIHFVKK